MSLDDIESVFAGPVIILPEEKNSLIEKRFRAIGTDWTDRNAFIVFTLRQKNGETLVRPISARYMHRKVLTNYEKDYPNL